MVGATSRVSLLTVGALASGGAAVIHAGASGAHAEHVALARIFIALAVAQAAAAALGLLRQDRWARVVLAGTNGLALGGWITTRFVPISSIDGLDTVEPIHVGDVAAATLALVAVGSAVLVDRPGLPALELSVGAVLVGALVVAGLADSVTHDHAAEASNGLAGVDPATGATERSERDALPRSEVDAIVQLGSTGAEPPPDHDHGELYRPGPVADHERDDLDAELAFAASVLDDVDTVEEAAALGYVMATAPSPGIGTHWVRWSQILEPFDLRRPAMLLFDHERTPAELVGYSYAVQSPDAPDGFSGLADEWHRHHGMCVALDGWVVRERAAGPEDCEGSYIAGGDFWMLHAWVVPGWENRDGVFAPINPKLCPAAAGTPDYLRCPGDAQI